MEGPRIPPLLRAGALATGVAVSGFVISLAAPAPPAVAHGVGGLEPTSYESALVGVEPPVPGLSIEVLDLGDTVELRNESGSEITVLGYDGEPYLRVGESGVFRNERSPATFWNRSVRPTDLLPPEFDATVEPEWAHISDRPVTRWHDHNVHWMGAGEPDDPDREQVVGRWEIPLLRGDQEIRVRGVIRWVPPPPAAFPLVGAAALAAMVFVGGRTRRWREVLLVVVAVLMGGEALHVAGQWGATTAGIGARALAAVYSLLGLAFGAYALKGLARRHADPYDAVPAALIAALVLTIAGGLAGVPALLASQLPTSLPDAVARSLVALSLGAGTGAVLLSATRLRRPPPTWAPELRE